MAKRCFYINGGIVIQWEPVTDENLLYYEVRLEDANWGTEDINLVYRGEFSGFVLPNPRIVGSCTATVGANPKTHFRDSTMVGDGANYYQNYQIIWTTGDNDGYTSNISAFDSATGEFTLSTATPNNIAVGNKYGLYWPDNTTFYIKERTTCGNWSANAGSVALTRNNDIYDIGDIHVTDTIHLYGTDEIKLSSVCGPPVSLGIDVAGVTVADWFNDHLDIYHYINVTDYVAASGGIHVGGTSDPGTDTLIVDGGTNLGSATGAGAGECKASGICEFKANADGTNVLGRAKIGSILGDDACFGHYDKFGVGTTAIRQTAAGATEISADTGQTVITTIAGATVVTCAATYTQLEGDLRVEGHDIGTVADTNLIGLYSGYGYWRGNLQVQGQNEIVDNNLFVHQNANYIVARLQVNSDTAWHSPFVYTYRGRGTKASPAAVQDNDSLHRLTICGYDGNSYQESARMEVFVDDAVADGQVPSRWLWYTTDAAGNLDLCLTLDDAQKATFEGVVNAKGGFEDNGTTGADGWFDDGANFRITVSGGLVTVIADSTAGGHS